MSWAASTKGQALPYAQANRRKAAQGHLHNEHSPIQTVQSRVSECSDPLGLYHDIGVSVYLRRSRRHHWLGSLKSACAGAYRLKTVSRNPKPSILLSCAYYTAGTDMFAGWSQDYLVGVRAILLQTDKGIVIA